MESQIVGTILKQTSVSVLQTDESWIKKAKLQHFIICCNNNDNSLSNLQTKKNPHYTWVSYPFRLVSLNSQVPHLLCPVFVPPLLLHFWPIFKCCSSCASVGTLLCHLAQQEKLDRKTSRDLLLLLSLYHQSNSQ